ncbi:2-amino-4-hydroxy-6-hydroxymethyldihydropteridine diphosphokinase [Rhizocola hellebori]|uniref:2-amino-4-hydroxy-6-hydroxymethyldihydropteridine diphosphokinase n=1 Tax=Rhizocola hellebori TaxID=1392758 RepID=A0A8J3QEZ2_9ACTN|nr:2-amino-4-hydroxy-6-hydroxymethyldihydropteridine diphosphokinase [Rhizocola hellebori]GIH08360.1 2-amino-4-hydroxy-6-hydroxymethyldihydropteridine diphosphokinase [Rhizocola hellebori]
MTQVVFSIGSNLGDRQSYLRGAVAGLAEVGEVQAVSGVYETPPWGDPDQPSYYNAVVLVTGELTVERWLEEAMRIEQLAQRSRDQIPRTLDVDLIAAWEDDGTPIIRETRELTLPHPRAHLRAFVLRPWLEIQPYAKLPGHGWVNDLVLSEDLADDVAAMTALPHLQIQSTP